VLSVSTRLRLVTPGARVQSQTRPHGIYDDTEIGFSSLLQLYLVIITSPVLRTHSFI